MLSNPLTLGLLTGAFAHGGGSWPASRQGTFELASERLAREHNDEHIAAVKVSPSVDTVLTAVGELCAIQLVAGIEGFSLGPAEDDSPYVALDRLQPPKADNDKGAAHLCRHALGTKLFSSSRDSEAAAGWPTMVPLHRQVAEFLGGRYLAGLVSDGLRASRVVALMISPHDGRIVWRDDAGKRKLYWHWRQLAGQRHLYLRPGDTFEPAAHIAAGIVAPSTSLMCPGPKWDITAALSAADAVERLAAVRSMRATEAVLALTEVNAAESLDALEQHCSRARLKRQLGQSVRVTRSNIAPAGSETVAARPGPKSNGGISTLPP